MNILGIVLLTIMFCCNGQKFIPGWFSKKPHPHELRFVHLTMYQYPQSKTSIALGMVDTIEYYRYQKANPDTASIVIPVNNERHPHDYWSDLIAQALFLPPLNPEHVNSIVFSTPFKHLTIGIVQEPVMADLQSHTHAAYAMITRYMNMLEMVSQRTKTITLLAYDGAGYEEYARLLIGIVSVLIQDHHINNELLYILVPNKKVMETYDKLLQQEVAPSLKLTDVKPSTLVRAIMQAGQASKEQPVSTKEKKGVPSPVVLPDIASAYPDYQELLADISFDLPKNPKMPETGTVTPSLPHIQQHVAVQSAALQRKKPHEQALPLLEPSTMPQEPSQPEPSAPPLEEELLQQESELPAVESSAPPLEPEEILIYQLMRLRDAFRALQQELQSV